MFQGSGTSLRGVVELVVDVAHAFENSMIDIIGPKQLDVALHRHDYSRRCRGAALPGPTQLHETTNVMDPSGSAVDASRWSQGTLYGHWAHLSSCPCSQRLCDRYRVQRA